MTVVASVAITPGASASTEISDACGPGAVSPSGIAPVYPEPQLPWLDLCGADLSGVSRAGPLRAVRSVLYLDGDVASGAQNGARYEARFNSEHCSVSADYKVFPGPLHESATSVEAHCDYRKVPCPYPESEVESAYPNYSCGEYDEFSFTDSPAVSVVVFGKSVAITFDPNKLPAGSVPSGLAHDLWPEGEPPELHYRSLRNAWVQTMLLQGVRRIVWTSGSPGDSAWATGDVPLD